jgi:hypothetical protein
MTQMTAREILEAFNRGLEAAAQNAKSVSISPNSVLPVNPSNKTLDAWTIRIVGNTQIDTLRKTYGDGFAQGYRGDTKLKTLLKNEGVKTVSQYLRLHGPRRG